MARIFIDTCELRALAQGSRAASERVAELALGIVRSASTAPETSTVSTADSVVSALRGLSARLADQAGDLVGQADLSDQLDQVVGWNGALRSESLAGLAALAGQLGGDQRFPWIRITPIGPLAGPGWSWNPAGLGPGVAGPSFGQILSSVDQLIGSFLRPVPLAPAFGAWPTGAPTSSLPPLLAGILGPIAPSGPTIVQQLDQLALNLGVQNALNGTSSLFADGTIAQLNNTLRIGSLIPGGLTVGGQLSSAFDLINRNAQLRAMGLLPSASVPGSLGQFAFGFSSAHLTPTGSVGQPLVHPIIR